MNPGADKRGRRRALSMTDAEINSYLLTQRTARVATVSASGDPHVAPLWFVWVDDAIWLNSLVRSQRWVDLAARAGIALVVDDGGEYRELRGVEIRGHADPVGDVPRTGVPIDVLDEPERAFAAKYQDSETFRPDGRHAWIRVAPERITSWDFRKLR